MSYYERAPTFYDRKEAPNLDGSVTSAIAAAEYFIEHEKELRTNVPYYSRRFCVAQSSKIIDKLGSGELLLKEQFDPQIGVTDQEIEKILKEGFDGEYACGLIHIALYRAKLLESQIAGCEQPDIDGHLSKARKLLNSSWASKTIKCKPLIILDILEDELEEMRANSQEDVL